MTEKQLNIIVTIWVALFVTGTAIQLYQIRQDKNLKNKNTYQLNSLKQISKLNFPINLLLMSIGILFLGLIAGTLQATLKIDNNKVYKDKALPSGQIAKSNYNYLIRIL